MAFARCAPLRRRAPATTRCGLPSTEFYRGGALLYRASSLVSYVGAVNVMRPATATDGGASASNDARCQGGRLIVNLLEARALPLRLPLPLPLLD